MRDALGIALSEVPYMGLWYKDDHSMFVSRLGYTGEDGFEIAVHNNDAPEIAKKLLEHDAVKPIGLAARDSLRLEMGYALYGHEITAETSPVEANMNWVIGKNRDGYFGSERIRKELAEGTQQKLVGVKLIDKGVAREGAELRNDADEKIGYMTSGGFSPSLKASIGMAYIDSALTEPGTKINVNVRGKNIAAEVASLPFIPAKTKTMKKKAA